MAAPVVVEGVAGGTAASAAGGAAAASAGRAASGASKGARASKGAGAGKAAASAPGTAGGRARELRQAGTSRTEARRRLRDEFGGTVAETDALLDDAWLEEQPADEQQPAARSLPSLPSLPTTPKAVAAAVDTGGGVLLGALGYVLALTYLRNGKDGVKAWLSAKFLNRVQR